jgi:DNA-binding transcriptional regulator YiaG
MHYFFEEKSTKLIKQAKSMSSARIKVIRASYGMTQDAFADLLNISYHTYRNWEIGHRKPCTSATALLMLAEQNPKFFLKDLALKEGVNVNKLVAKDF